MTDKAESTPKSASTKRPAMRRGVALTIVGIGSLGFLATNLFDSLKFCREELATVGEQAVVRVCGPLPAVALIPILLIALGLLWPDLSEFAIPGVVSVKRKIEEQERRQDRLEGALFHLQQSQSQTTNVHLVARPDPEATQVKLERFEKDPESLSDLASTIARPSPRFEQLITQIHGVWANLEPLTEASPNSPWWDELSDGQRYVLTRWQQGFADELDFVRGVRNAVYFGRRRVAEEDLADAVEVGQKLYSLIASKLRHPAFAARGRREQPDQGDADKGL